LGLNSLKEWSSKETDKEWSSKETDPHSGELYHCGYDLANRWPKDL